MYKEFYSKNYAEYTKIIKIIDSCKTWEQFVCIEDIAYNFARNCEWRTNKLFDHYERGFSIKRYKDFRKYEGIAKMQCEDLMERVKGWAEAYQYAAEEANRLISQNEENAKKRKIVNGFGGLLNKTKRCKRKR